MKSEGLNSRLKASQEAGTSAFVSIFKRVSDSKLF